MRLRGASPMSMSPPETPPPKSMTQPQMRSRGASPMSISHSDSPMSISPPETPPLQIVCDEEDEYEYTPAVPDETTSFYEIREEKHVKFKHGPVEEHMFKIAIVKDIPGETPLERQVNLQHILESAFNKVISIQHETACNGQFVIMSKEFIKETTSTPLKRIQDISFEDVAHCVGRILNSDESLDLNQTNISLVTYSTDVEIGGVGRSISNRNDPDLMKHIKRKRCFYNPLNYNTQKKISQKMSMMCLPLCLVREIKLVEMKRKHGTAAKRFMVNFGQTRECLSKAQQLVADANVSPPYGPFKLSTIAAFARFLPQGCALNVFVDSKPPILKFNHKNSRDVIHLFLLFDETPSAEPCLETGLFHTYSIADEYLAAFFGKKSICRLCFRGVGSQKNHKCQIASCKLCKDPVCANTDSSKKIRKKITCETCGIWWHTNICFQTHLTNCSKKWKCTYCWLVIKKSEKMTHLKKNCGLYCRTCNSHHSAWLPCFVKKPVKKKTPEILFYCDAEAVIDPGTGNHRCNLVVVQKGTDDPMDESTEEIIYKGFNAMENFVKDCLAENSRFKQSKLVFHNFAKYDGALFFRELVRLKCPPKQIIRRGQQIIQMKLAQNSISTRDSLLFLPGTPLSNFCKLFNTKESKGTYPFKLNGPRWVDFNEPDKVYTEYEADGTCHRFPKLEYFMPETKSAKASQKLKTWHEEQVEKHRQNASLVYQPTKELIQYCQLDTKILRQGMTKFCQTFHDQFPEMKVFDSLTFSSLNNAVFRKYFMPENSIALISPRGYPSSNRRFSVLGLAYVAWMEVELGLVCVRDARRGGEVKLAGTHIDGFGLDPTTGDRHVLEYHGCRWHGHSCLQPRTQDLDICDEESQQRDKRLHALSIHPNSPYGFFHLHIMYECEFKSKREKNTELDKYVRDFVKQYYECKTPLNLRESLRGGRTNAILHNIPTLPQGYTLSYYDFTSLYPAVQYFNEYPIGFPQIFYGKLLEKAPKPGAWFGFVRARVLPNQSLFHPVLGHLVGSKLLFSSCFVCSQHANDKFPPTNILKCNHTDDERAFTSVYFTKELDLAINHGYKILKTYELYHWPEEQRTTELFKNLIRGFLGKKTAMENTDYLVDYSDFLKLSSDPEKEIVRVEVDETGDAIFVTWKPREEKASGTGSVALASIVTAYARIKLYQLIDRYREHVAYFDTDSVILFLPPNVPKPETSTMLGGLKDEVFDKWGYDARITSFCSLGPKSYSYTVNNSAGDLLESVTKMKGIRFNQETERTLCDGGLVDLVNNPSKIYHVPQYIIARDLFKGRLYSKVLLKRVAFNSRKRQLLNDRHLSTVPYGYVKPSE